MSAKHFMAKLFPVTL